MSILFPSLTVRELQKALDRTLPFTSIRTDRPALCGVHFRFGHFIEVTGSDGSILSSLRFRTDPRTGPHPEFTVPGTEARVFRKLLKRYEPDDTVEFAGLGDHGIRLCFSFGPPVAVPILEENYPDYEKLFKPAPDFRTTCLIRLVELADACHETPGDWIDLRLTPGKGKDTGMIATYPSGCDIPSKVFDASPATAPNASLTYDRRHLTLMLRGIRASDDFATVCFPDRARHFGTQFLGESELHRTLIRRYK